MCGITGFVGGSAGAAVLQKMMDRIAHRGPDGQGQFLAQCTAGTVALGHLRLSIIDLDGGAQPMFNETGRLAVVFNGEIYNYRELTAELKAAGHRFSTSSDTEVLLHGYEEWGRGLPGHLRGMFAFALYDLDAETLFCARDPFGIKPLYYGWASDGTFLFGSEIKAFLPHPAFHRELNEAQLELYLTYQYSPGTATFFKDVYKLPPAHWLALEPEQKLTLHRYWKPVLAPDNTPTRAEWSAAVEAVMRQSVAAHKIADVEVGSFLSSGVDSSYVAALARVDKTFTVGFADRRYDETAYAAQFCRELGFRSFTHRITPQEFWDALPRIQYHMDEPLADAAAAALYFLNREAAAQVKVVLSGEGADELFGGYNIYNDPFTARWYDALPAPLRRALGQFAQRLPAGPGTNFLVRRSVPLTKRYIGVSSLMTERQKQKLLRNYTGETPPTALSAPLLAAAWADGLDTVAQLQSCDIQLWLAGDILLKADKMSMAHSLELRVPFLDTEVFALASRLPTAHKVDGRQTKLALRAAAARSLPERTAEKRKLGFPVPVREWLRQEPYFSRVQAAFTGATAARFFDTEALRTLLLRHKKGRQDNWRQIWCVFMFLVWYEQFFGGESLPAAPPPLGR